jgi:hypothetical protein
MHMHNETSRAKESKSKPKMEGKHARMQSKKHIQYKQQGRKGQDKPDTTLTKHLFCIVSSFSFRYR